MVERLSSKCEALSSNPNTAKKKKKERKKKKRKICSGQMNEATSWQN
jgi:hypothetical protein